MLGYLDRRLRDLVLPTKLANVPNTGTGLLHRIHAVQHVEQQRIARDTLGAQIRFLHPCGQSARTDDFDPVLEDVNLDVRSRAVVAVCNGIRHRFSQSFFGQFRSASISSHPHRKHLRPPHVQANGHLPVAQGRQIAAAPPRRHPSQLVSGQHVRLL